MEQQRIPEEPETENPIVLDQYTLHTQLVLNQKLTDEQTLQTVRNNITEIEEVLDKKTQTILDLWNVNEKMKETIDTHFLSQEKIYKLLKMIQEIMVYFGENYNQIKNIARVGKDEGDKFYLESGKVAEYVYIYKERRKKYTEELSNLIGELKEIYAKNKERTENEMKINMEDYTVKNEELMHVNNEINELKSTLKEFSCKRLTKIEKMQEAIEEKDIILTNIRNLKEKYHIDYQKNEAEKQSADGTILELKSQINLYEERLINLQAEYDNLQSAIESQTDFIKEIENGNNKLELAIQNNKDKCVAQQNKITDLKNYSKLNYGQCQIEITNIEKEIKKLEDYHNILKQENILIEQKIANFKELNDKLNKDCDQVLIDIQAIEENTKAQELLQESTTNAYINEMQGKETELQNALADKKEQMELEHKYQIDLSKIKEHINAFESEYENMKSTAILQGNETASCITDLKYKNKELETKYVEAKRELEEELRKKESELKIEEEKAKEHLFKITQDADREKNEIKLQNEAEKDICVNKIKTLEGTLQIMDMKLLKLNADKGSLQDELDNQTEQINQLMKEIERIKRTKTYREADDGLISIHSSPRRVVSPLWGGDNADSSIDRHFAEILKNKCPKNLFTSTQIDENSDHEEKKNLDDLFDKIRKASPSCETPVVRSSSRGGKRSNIRKY